MLSSYRTPSRHRQWKPGRRVGRKGLLLQGHPRPWPFAKARTFGAPAPKVPARIKVRGKETGIPRPAQSSCRRVQLRCGSVRRQISTGRTSLPAHIWRRPSKAFLFHLGAIPPGTAPLEPSTSLRLRSPSSPAPGMQSLPGTQKAALQAAGAAGAGCLSAPASAHTLRYVPPGPSASQLPLRRWAPSVQGLRPRPHHFEATLLWAVPSHAA